MKAHLEAAGSAAASTMRHGILFALFGLACSGPAWSLGADAKPPAWSSDRQFRMLVQVEPASTGGRTQDEGVARAEIDFAKQTGGQRVDASSLQVVGYDPRSGEPIAYPGSAAGRNGGERPFRFYDAAIPWEFPEGEGYAHSSNGTGKPARILAGGGRYLGIVGEGLRGSIVWNHVQQGNHPAYYAIYFNSQPADRPQTLAPAGFVGDGSNRCSMKSPNFFPLYHSRVDTADVTGDGLFDLVVGNMNGTIMIYPNVGTPSQARFGAGKLVLTDKGEVLDIGYSSAPRAVDWDHDGDLDLIVGAEKESFVYFRNVGTRTSPQYHLEGLLADSDGKPIRVPRAPCEEDPEGKTFPYDYYPVPDVVDWDGDGDPDLIVGGFITGRIWFYENIAASLNEDPKLKFRGAIQADGKDIDVTWMAAPTVADFDGDGDLDLISGAMQMTAGGGDKSDPDKFLWYYENIGSRREPKLTLRPFPARGRFSHGLLGTPRAMDFNGDGLLDLVVSASTDLLLIPNIGSREKPLFDASTPPVPGAWGNAPLGFDQLVDYDGDGWPDLFRGDRVLLNDPAKPGSFEHAREIALLAPGKRIHHPSPRGDHWEYFLLADLDGDSKRDVLVGTHAGHVWWHQNRGTLEKPDIDPEGVRLALASGELIRVGMPPTPADGNAFDDLQGARTTMDLGDFNRDGLADLLVCDTYGVIRLFLREPGKELRFGLPADLARLVHIRLTARTIDWNGDGWPDILATYAGSQTYLLMNRGVSGRAEFEKPVEIKVPEYPMSWPFLHVADWNHDGDVDLLFHYGPMVRYVERSFIDHSYLPAKVIAEEKQGGAAGPTGVSDSRVEPIVVAPVSHFAQNSFPTVVKLNTGRLMCVFSAHDAKTGNKNTIAASYSEDQARTWSEPVILIDTHGELDYDPSIVVIGQRVLVTSTTCPPTHGSRISTSRTMAVMSDDDGRTFSKPYEIPMGHRFTAGKVNPGVTLSDGTALFGFSWDLALDHGGAITSEGDHHLAVGLMVSRDGGKQWLAGGEVRLDEEKSAAQPASAISGVDEPAIVQCGDGSLYMLCRTGHDHLYESRSRDGGRTWSKPTPSGLVGHNAPASLCRLDGGHPALLVVWCNSPKNRWPLCTAVSSDNGRTWSKPITLSNVPGFQSSYPGCVMMDDGRPLAVWQQDLPNGKRAILGARLSMDMFALAEAK